MIKNWICENITDLDGTKWSKCEPWCGDGRRYDGREDCDDG